MPLFQEDSNRQALFRRMIQKTGGPNCQQFFHEANLAKTAFLKCNACKCASECEKWLDTAPIGASPPEFCPNSAWMALK